MIKPISGCSTVVLYEKRLNEAGKRVRNLLRITHLPQALIYLRKQVTGMLGRHGRREHYFFANRAKKESKQERKKERREEGRE